MHFHMHMYLDQSSIVTQNQTNVDMHLFYFYVFVSPWSWTVNWSRISTAMPMTMTQKAFILSGCHCTGVDRWCLGVITGKQSQFFDQLIGLNGVWFQHASWQLWLNVTGERRKREDLRLHCFIEWERGGRDGEIWQKPFGGSMIYMQIIWGVLYFSLIILWFIIQVWVLMTVSGRYVDVSATHFLSTCLALHDTE